MNSPRRRSLALFVGVCSALLLTSCEPPAPTVFPFVSRAKPATGEPIPLSLAPRAGDAYAWAVTINGSLTRSLGKRETAVPVDMTYRMLYRCQEVLQNGDSRWTAAIEHVGGRSVESQPDAAERLELVKGVRLTLILDRLGHRRSLLMQGAKEETRASWRQTGSVPPGQFFVALPEQPVRLGQAFDWAKSFEAKELRGLLGAEDKNLVFRSQGEAVPTRLAKLDGQDAVELDLNLVLDAQGDIGEGDESATVRTGLRFTGTQRIARASGLTVGELALAMEQDTRITGPQGDVSVKGTLQFRGRLTRVEPAPQPAAR